MRSCWAACVMESIRQHYSADMPSNSPIPPQALLLRSSAPGPLLISASRGGGAALPLLASAAACALAEGALGELERRLTFTDYTHYNK